MNFKYLTKIKRYFFDEKERVIPNILITNYCNQNCSFCFASKLMKNDGTKEMSLKNYKNILNNLKKSGQKKVSLMGGEPTLHKDFKKLIELTINMGLEIELFTNGQFSNETADFLISIGEGIKMYHINIASPAYGIKEKREQINKFIDKASKKSMIALETTIGSMDKDILKKVFKGAKSVLKYSYIRIGVDGALVNRGGFSLEKNLKIGKIITYLSDYLFDNKVKGLWLSEVNPCMFSDNEIQKMSENPRINWKGYGCFSKNGGVDIKVDAKVIRCFGQDCFDGVLYDEKSNLEKIKKNLDTEMVKKSKKSLPVECMSCIYFGYKDNQCPGPCLIGRK